jgi:dTDP-4-amino-4,6-dideoxygalactose transaminase
MADPGKPPRRRIDAGGRPCYRARRTHLQPSRSAGSMSHPIIPLVGLDRQHGPLREAILAAMASVLDQGAFIGGREVEAFEAEFAAYLPREFCIGAANGTDALGIAFEALGIGHGHEVIVPAMTFFASAEGVSLAGATPVFCDIDPATANLDPARLAERVGPRTRAILAVHLYGQPAAMDAIMAVARQHGLRMVEDCAQSQGARYRGRRTGTFGDIAAFSFYPSKNLGAAGDAGALVTDDPDLARRCRMLANHGGMRRYEHQVVGHNSRLDALQAAVLRLKLPHLDRWNAERRDIAARYRERLAQAPLELLDQLPEVEHAQHLFVVRVEERDRTLAALREQGVMADIHYPEPLHLVPAYADLGLGPEACPVAAHHARTCLSLPIFPGMRAEEVERVADTLLAALRA